MRTGISITVSTADRERLQAVVKDRNAAQKLLLSAAGIGANEIMRRTSRSKTCVWQWQERFMEEGVGGSSARQDPPLSYRAPRAIVALTQQDRLKPRVGPVR